MQRIGLLWCMVVLMTGCMGSSNNNNGLLQSYAAPTVESSWIRNGEALDFDGRKWYPIDDYENLLDNEVYQIGEYRDVALFVEKTDTKPYDRIYTKFAKGKFRYFEKQYHD